MAGGRSAERRATLIAYAEQREEDERDRGLRPRPAAHALPPRALLRAPDRQRADARPGRSLPGAPVPARARRERRPSGHRPHPRPRLARRARVGRAQAALRRARLPAAGRGLGARVRRGSSGRRRRPTTWRKKAETRAWRGRRGAPECGRRPARPAGARPAASGGGLPAREEYAHAALTRTDLEAINDALQAEIADLTDRIGDWRRWPRPGASDWRRWRRTNGALPGRGARLAAALARSSEAAVALAALDAARDHAAARRPRPPGAGSRRRGPGGT